MALALASCGAGKQATIADLGGEWVITSADGNTLNAETTPFIGINAADGTVYGSTGCNNLVGTLDKNQKPGTVDFSQLGSTRMMCADMTSERIVMDMLNVHNIAPNIQNKQGATFSMQHACTKECRSFKDNKTY